MTTRAWCCLRLRFDDRELSLLRGAEAVRGSTLAQAAKPAQLRTALNLARVGRKLSTAAAGATVSLEENELALVLDALRQAADELQWLGRVTEDVEPRRRQAVMDAFPELRANSWRTFGLTRELESLTARLDQAVKS